MSVISSLAAYWALNEASGTRFDSHGSTHLSETNPVASATGLVGTAADFEDADSACLSVATNAVVETGDIDFSFALWAKVEAFGNFPTLLAKDNNVVREYGFYVNSPSGTDIFFYVFSPGGSFAQAGAGVTLTTATWYFVVGIHDAINDTIGISVNNGTLTTSAFSGGVRVGSAVFAIGARTDLGSLWDGLVDEVGFWKKALTPTERTWLYNSGAGRSYADIVAEAGGGGVVLNRRIYGRQAVKRAAYI